MYKVNQNNPVNFIDPLGLRAVMDGGGSDGSGSAGGGGCAKGNVNKGQIAAGTGAIVAGSIELATAAYLIYLSSLEAESLIGLVEAYHTIQISGP